jgi:hypothetical protein
MMKKEETVCQRQDKIVVTKEVSYISQRRLKFRVSFYISVTFLVEELRGD